MLKWNDVLGYARNGNLSPDKRVERSEDEWRMMLDDEVFRVTRQHGTEMPHSSDMCGLFEPGIYACACCETLLFDAGEKFDSGTGWPSFTLPVAENVINYHEDTSLGMSRVETTCSTCDAHLGHVFPDGPMPSGLRYCMNGVALNKAIEKPVTELGTETSTELSTATFGGGCFWCTEAIFQRLKGVDSVRSGYSGGEIENPSYERVCSGSTGHAEVVQVIFDENKISYKDLLRIHLTTHDPTTLNQQGADTGTQYRSIILAEDDEQFKQAEDVIEEVQDSFKDSIVTEVAYLSHFYEAELRHQDYYNGNQDNRYCQAVIDPKIKKFKELYADKIV